MRIVSLNAWGGQLWPDLAAWLPTVAADVLLLQEVTRAPGPSPDWVVYTDPKRRLDQRADLFADVSQCLPRHQALFAAAARGTLADATGRDVPSEHGIAAWIAPGLAVAGQVQRFVHGRFRHDGWLPLPEPRTMQAFRLADPERQVEIAVAHVHGLHDPAGKHDTSLRAAQAEAIVATLDAVADQEEPRILLGDFNVLPGSATLLRLGKAGLTDLIERHGIPDTRTSHYKKSVRHADYTFVSDSVHVRRFEVPGAPEVSDHRPMILDIDL